MGLAMMMATVLLVVAASSTPTRPAMPNWADLLLFMTFCSFCTSHSKLPCSLMIAVIPPIRRAR